MATVTALIGLFVMTASGSAPIDQTVGGSPQQAIVVFHDSVSNPAETAAQIASAHDAQLGFVYQDALKGFSAAVSPRALASIERDPRVAYVELDQLASIVDQTIPTGIQRIFADENPEIDIDSTDDKRVDVDVAIIDTGIDFEHTDLNVVGGVECSGNPFNASCSSGGDDDNGHGTHVAGTVGALDNGFGVVGVAPGARLWAVKVLDHRGSGWYSEVIAGVDWVTERKAEFNDGSDDDDPGINISVANMSLGGGSSDALCEAITGSVSEGVAYAVAAGNSADDANNYSPADCGDVLTISALADFDGDPDGLGSPTCRDDQDDTFADFSNFGDDETKNYTVGGETARTVPLIAPGVCILSTVPGGGYDTFSGTSMASPHGAGALALLASTSNPSNANDAYALYATVISEGNDGWSDGDDPDAFKEPLLDVGDSTVFAPVLVAGSSAPSTDIAITSVSAPSSAVQGEVVEVSVTLENVGTEDVTADVNVTLTDDTDGGTIGTQTISGGLAAGASTNLTYSWDTGSATLGEHTLTGSHDFADDDASNDSLSTVATVESAVTDISVTAVSAPSSVVQGDVVSVDVTVENTGNQDVTSEITVTLTDDTDGVTIGTQTISGGLAAGASNTLTFDWETSTATLGDHTLTAAHNFADDDASSDSLSTVATVESAVTDIAVTAVSAPSSVVQGDVVEVSLTVENVGNQDVTADINVTLVSDNATPSDTTDDIMIGTQTISGGLAAGASITLTFSWDTTDTTLGDHTLTASHDFADEDPSNDSNITVVTVNEPPAPGENDMWVEDIEPSVSTSGIWTNVNATVTILSGDGSVQGASMTFVLSRDTDCDGAYEDSFTFTETTDSSGEAFFNLKTTIYEACWQGEVTVLDHDTYTWNSALDTENPNVWRIFGDRSIDDEGY